MMLRDVTAIISSCSSNSFLINHSQENNFQFSFIINFLNDPGKVVTQDENLPVWNLVSLQNEIVQKF